MSHHYRYHQHRFWSTLVVDIEKQSPELTTVMSHYDSLSWYRNIYLQFDTRPRRTWSQQAEPSANSRKHDDVIKWKHFPRHWPFMRGIHRSSVNSPNKGQWRGALMFPLVCIWNNSWINNGEAGDLRCHRAHYYVIVMKIRNFRYGWLVQSISSWAYAWLAIRYSTYPNSTYQHCMIDI